MPAVFADPALAARFSKGWFCSFDPGLSHPAIALWLRGTLVAATRVSVPGKLKKLDRLERVRQIAKLVGDTVRRGIAAHDSPNDVGELTGLFCEFPQWYSARAQQRSGKSPDPNRLAGMASLDGALAVELGVETWSYLPGEWCGGLAKTETGDPWLCPRGRVLRSRLRAEEIANIVPTHDALDAVGVGLKALCRLEQNLAGTT